MTSRQALETELGLTQASSVMPELSWSDDEFGTLTRALVPLKTRAPPYFPVAVQVVFETVPVFPVPDASAVVVPDPSLNEYAATSPEGPAACVVPKLVFESAPRLPAASTAR